MFFKLLVAGVAAWSMSEIKIDADQLAKMSDFVVDGSVESAEVSRENGWIWTTYVVKPSQLLYSKTSEQSSRFVIKQLGGKIGDETTFVPGQKTYEVGKRYVFFFNNGRPTTTSGTSVTLTSHSYGLWSVEGSMAVPPSTLGIRTISVSDLHQILPMVIKNDASFKQR